MLSRLYSKYGKKDMGMMIAYLVGFFVFSCLPLFLGITSMGSSRIMKDQSYMDNLALSILLISSPCCTVASLLSIFEARRQFSFLNDRSKVDFFYSLPVNRNHMFFTRYLTGMIYVLVPFLINMILALITASIYGTSGEIVKYILFSILFEVLIFWFFYTICVLLSIATGKKIVYGAVLFLVNTFGYILYFYVNTVFSHQLDKWDQMDPVPSVVNILEKIPTVTSPFYYYIGLLDNVIGYEYPEDKLLFDTQALFKPLVVILPITILLLVLTLLLFKRISAERGSNSFLFAKIERPVQIVVTIMLSTIIGQLFSIFFGSSNTALPVAIATTIITLIIHSVFETSYAGDFRKIFRHRYQLLICMALSVTGAVYPLL